MNQGCSIRKQSFRSNIQCILRCLFVARDSGAHYYKRAERKNTEGEPHIFVLWTQRGLVKYSQAPFTSQEHKHVTQTLHCRMFTFSFQETESRKCVCVITVKAKDSVVTFWQSLMDALHTKDTRKKKSTSAKKQAVEFPAPFCVFFI